MFKSKSGKTKRPDERVPEISCGNFNVVPRKLFRYKLAVAANVVKELLYRHCGSNSAFNMTIDAHRPMVEPVFTKDGVNVISAVEATDPTVYTLIKEFAYVGKAVDRLIGDGTTTSMGVLAGVISEILAEHARKSTPKPGETDYPSMLDVIEETSYQDLLKEYDEMAYEVLRLADQWTLTVETVAKHLDCHKEHAIKLIAYSQAMTSSHGDHELSKAIAEVFSTLSPESWPHLTFQRDVLETEKRVRCVVEDCHYQLRVYPAIPAMLSEDVGTAFRRDNCLLLVCSGCMDDLGAPHRQLTEILGKAPADRPIVLLLSGNTDAMMQEQLRQLHAKCPNLTAFYHDIASPMDTSHLVGISIVADQVPTHQSQQLTVVDGVRVDVSNHLMRLYNLYQNPIPLEGNLHPATQEPNSLLNYFLKQIEGIIEKQLDAAEQTLEIVKEKQRLQMLCHRIRHTKLAYIKIGGNIYDNVATQDVVTDALKAARSSLLHGFTMAGNYALTVALCLYIADYVKISEYPDTKSVDTEPGLFDLSVMFANQIQKSLAMIVQAALGVSVNTYQKVLAHLVIEPTMKVMYDAPELDMPPVMDVAILCESWVNACSRCESELCKDCQTVFQTYSSQLYNTYVAMQHDAEDRRMTATLSKVFRNTAQINLPGFSEKSPQSQVPSEALYYMAIQPARLQHELLNRFREVALRLLKTTECTVRNAPNNSPVNEGV